MYNIGIQFPFIKNNYLKIIKSIRKYHVFPEHKALLQGIEQNVDGSDHYSSIPGAACHGVRFSRSCDSISEEESIFTLD